MPSKSHGMTQHLAYGVWLAMRYRCNKSTDPSWENYGGRGIKVSKRWDKSFENFWKDMGPSYKQGLTLERLHNDKNYTPTNCVWATRTAQQRNRRNNRMFDTPWGRLCMTEACQRAGFGVTTLTNRLRYGWPADKLFIKADAQNRFSSNLKRTGSKGKYS